MIHFDRFKAKIDNILSATIFMRTLGGGNTMEGLIWETSEELDKKLLLAYGLSASAGLSLNSNWLK